MQKIIGFKITITHAYVLFVHGKKKDRKINKLVSNLAVQGTVISKCTNFVKDAIVVLIVRFHTVYLMTAFSLLTNVIKFRSNVLFENRTLRQSKCPIIKVLKLLSFFF